MSEKSESKKNSRAIALLHWYASAYETEFNHDIAAELRVSIAALEADAQKAATDKAATDDAQKHTREIDRVICDHDHVSDQVRDLQRAVLRVCDVIDVLMDVARLDRLSDGTIRRLVAHEVGRHSGDPIEWVPKRESPFRAEGE